MGLRIVFMGTGRLALPVFEALCASTHTVAGLVTQPDRTGRGHHHHVNPLKELALARGTPVFQPDNIKTPESVALLREWQADLQVVAAYGQILSAEVLHLPRFGTINVHASLLPKYRGATPIHAAVLNGDAESGVTIIQLEPKLDAGPMLGVVRTPIGPDDTTGDLDARLAELAGPLTLQVIGQIEAGTTTPVLQDPALVTRAGKLTKQDGRIPWNRSAVEVERHVRGMQPWPMAFTTMHLADRPPLRVLVQRVRVADADSRGVPGTVVEATAERCTIQCGTGRIDLVQVQPDGKRPMAVAEFLRGYRPASGDQCE